MQNYYIHAHWLIGHGADGQEPAMGQIEMDIRIVGQHRFLQAWQIQMVLVRKWGDNAQAVLQGQKTRGDGIPDGVETVDNGNVEQQAFQPDECTVNLAEGKPEQRIIAVQVFGCHTSIERIPSLDEGVETIDGVEVGQSCGTGGMRRRIVRCFLKETPHNAGIPIGKFKLV